MVPSAATLIVQATVSQRAGMTKNSALMPSGRLSILKAQRQTPTARRPCRRCDGEAPQGWSYDRKSWTGWETTAA
jgi:hypothetical protein